MKKIDDAINVMKKGNPSLLTEEDVMMGCLALMEIKSLKDVFSAATIKEPNHFNIVQVVKNECYKAFDDMIDISIASIENVYEDPEKLKKEDEK